MNILSISNLSKSGRGEMLFADASFGLEEGGKAAVIGRNGAGKSTLLGIIAGTVSADSGTVALRREAGVSFLPQSPAFSPDDTIRDHIFRSDSPKLAVIREYQEACALLGERNDAAVRRRYDALCLRMDDGGLWNYEAQVASVLSTLGIDDLSRRMGALSGGMVKKVALAQALVEDSGLLLLDEPTNHLDMATIAWLQEYLCTTKRAVLMATHDRYFLDEVCGTIYEIARRRVRQYQGNYSAYLERKAAEAEAERNMERRIESVLRTEREWLLRGPCARGTKAKARIQRDQRLIGRERFREERGFSFEVKGRRLGGKVLELRGVSKFFPKGCSAGSGRPVITDFSYTFTKGQRIGIFGGNGSGKSTFLNLVTGTVPPDSGSVEAGAGTVFGYYNQNPAFADASLTALEYVRESAEFITGSGGRTRSAAVFLEEFGFSGKMQHSPVSALSGGEKKRLFLVRLLLSDPNFLVLDEPTNDFDIFTMNILEQFLSEFEGCLLVVSHDRYFMDKVADSLFIMEDDGSISGFAGKCSEYIAYRRELAASPAGVKAAEQPAPQGGATEARRKRRSFAQQKEFEAVEASILELEEWKGALEASMGCAAPGAAFGGIEAAAKEYRRVSALLEAQYSRWEELAAIGE